MHTATKTTDDTRRYDEAFRALELAHVGPPWLRALRTDALTSFSARGLPTRRDERYRKLDVTRELSHALPVVFPRTSAGVADETRRNPALSRESVARRYRDGVLVEERGAHGAILASHALADFDALIDPLFAAASCVKTSALMNLNLALHHEEGVVVVPAGATLDAPIVLDHEHTAREAEHFPRSLVVVRTGAHATLVERFSADGASRVIAAVDVVVEEGASLSHVVVHEGAASAKVFAHIRARVATGGAYALTSFALTDGLLRSDVDISLDGRDASCTIAGLTLGKGSARVDHHTTIVHESGHATSRQLMKSALADLSKLVFSGAVHFTKGAEKSDTAQSSKAILLSPGAEADQKPELMIFADDVKASHGSTVGQLDDDALFYLRSRGVPMHEAHAMLVRAFTEEIVDAVPEGAAREHVAALVSARIDALEHVDDAGKAKGGAP